MAENFKFKGRLNGVDYATPEAFVKALKEATENNAVRSIEYSYSSSSEAKQSDRNPEKGSNSDSSRDLVDPMDTITRVTKIKEIVGNVAELSERVSDTEGNQFNGEDLNNFEDIVKTSLENVAYLISGMNTADRSDFCSRMLPGVKRLFEEAESEAKDIQYEEAKYRSQLIEDNKEIEEEISQNQKDYDENCQEIEWSENRSTAVGTLSGFFRDLLSLVKNH
jgi:hypothetical protein